MGLTDYSKIPTHMQQGAIAYVENGIEPGGFMRAILENDFVDALGRADEVNIHFLSEWAHWLRWQIPAECWGCRQAVNHWIKVGGLSGNRKRA